MSAFWGFCSSISVGHEISAQPESWTQRFIPFLPKKCFVNNKTFLNIEFVLNDTLIEVYLLDIDSSEYQWAKK